MTSAPVSAHAQAAATQLLSLKYTILGQADNAEGAQLRIAKLFDLEADPQELSDLSATEPATFEELKARYAAWDKSLPPRAWTNISPVFKK